MILANIDNLITLMIVGPVVIVGGFVLFLVVLTSIAPEQPPKAGSDMAKQGTEPLPVPSAVVVSKDDGRVIAQVAPEPQPVMPAAAPPPKDAGSVVGNATRQVATKAAANIAWYLIKIALRPRH